MRLDIDGLTPKRVRTLAYKILLLSEDIYL